ncbi:hypothetical protein N7462_002023 [Penicillium macrosclerotiorum]|uniref:uncharacterized protein n=1 Tax=Penicillium macrosclerotiorum TaxID=303699 RepID=UPI00254964EA|nr:uncharacterized protein N7462_002023 [Penicillium macrosclerotiorum]KAJ5692600.1 hypothetical protein N7462_002023 [Penicillium macrosclerotiorum]
MVGPHAGKRAPAYQPFQCPQCLNRFTRHENLKRHTALHSRSQAEASVPCELCPATFSRPDLRHRHMKRKHPEHEHEWISKSTRRRSPTHDNDAWATVDERVNSSSPPDAQEDCFFSDRGNKVDLGKEKVTWEVRRQSQTDFGHPIERTNNYVDTTTKTGQIPLGSIMDDMNSIDRIVQDATDLERSLLLETSLFTSGGPTTTLHPEDICPSTSYGPSLANLNMNSKIPDTLLLSAVTPPREDWSPSALQINHGCDLFFRHVSPFVPFIHHPTFDTNSAPHNLLVSMLSISYHYGEDPECVGQEGSGVDLSRRCFHRARGLLALSEDNTHAFSDNVTMVQSYLLLQICAMMYLCGNDSAYGLKMHSNMISLARTSGMMQPMPAQSTVTEDLESLWRQFVKAESHKRTLFALHQIDALWYQFLSIPRSISHLEIKHELPSPREIWNASSSSEWAHRRLVSNSTGPSVQYADAVRRFLSPDADINSIPPFDPYGAINIAQFLISSAREISGWSTMTGIISMERFGALRSSLIALGPFICPERNSSTSAPSGASWATWQTAMIELQMWSPSHTGGIIEGSIDALLTQSTSLAPTFDFLCDAGTASSIQPHINWFLCYLDEIPTPQSEAPWILLYAYKAFLIAWQLVRGKIPGAMCAVGVADGDEHAALAWARKVFERRRQLQLVKLITSCLANLNKH